MVVKEFFALIDEAHGLMNNHCYSKAVSLFEKAIPLSDDNHNKAVAFGNIGFCYSKLGNNDEARTYLKAALKYDEHYAIVFFNLGKIDEEEGNLESAIKNYERAIEIDPEYDTAYSNKGICLAQQEKYAEAAQCFAKAGSLCRDNPAYQNNAGVCYACADEPKKALAYFARQIHLVRKSGNVSEAFVNVAQCYFVLNDLFRAAKAAHRAIKLNDKNGRAYEELGDIMAAMNQFSRAVFDYTNALRHAPREELLEKLTSAASASKLFSDCTDVCRDAAVGVIKPNELLKFLDDKIVAARLKYDF